MSLRIKLIQFLVDINEKLVFYPKLKKFYKSHLPKNNILLFDVGVNKGQTIDFFNKFISDIEIHGFEPNPTLYKRLQSKYSKTKNIILNNIGISDVDGKLIFYENIMDETSSLQKLNYDSEYLRKKAKILGVEPKDIIQKQYFIDVLALSQYIQENNIAQIDVLKIDTEGHELNCLVGLFKKVNSCNIKFIQLEQHNDDMYIDGNKNDEIIGLLKKHNYSEVKRIKHGFGDFHEIVFSKEDIK